MLAKSAGVPDLLSGYLASIAARFSSDEKKLAANGVSVSAGARQLTRVCGASSAASERLKPSIAPFAAAIDACIGSPLPTATVLNKTILVGCSLAPRFNPA